MATTTPNNRLRDLLPGSIAEVDSLLDQFFGPAGNPLSNQAGWRTPASLWEDDEQLHLEIDAPGVNKEAVEVTFDKGTLTVTLERSRPEDRKFVHNERRFGKLTRTLALPDTVDPDTIQAGLTDGVLRISIAKRPEIQPKKIELS